MTDFLINIKSIFFLGLGIIGIIVMVGSIGIFLFSRKNKMSFCVVFELSLPFQWKPFVERNTANFRVGWLFFAVGFLADDWVTFILQSHVNLIRKALDENNGIITFVDTSGEYEIELPVKKRIELEKYHDMGRVNFVND